MPLGRILLVGTLPAAAVGVLVAAAVGGAHDLEVVARTAANIAAAGTLGVLALPYLRSGVVSPDRVARPAAQLAGMWFFAALFASWAGAALRSGVGLFQVNAAEILNVEGAASAQTVVVVVVAAVAVWSAVAARAGDPPVAILLAVTIFGLVLGPVTGHMSVTPYGAVAVTAHVLAAGWWCGTLAALALLARGRREWAELLPAFSRYAGYAVPIVFVSGVISALSHTTDLTSAYARVAIEKLVLLAVLVAAGWYQRRRWVPSAAAHRSTETLSVRRASIEVIVMAAVFGVAASLSQTG